MSTEKPPSFIAGITLPTHNGKLIDFGIGAGDVSCLLSYHILCLLSSFSNLDHSRPMMTLFLSAMFQPTPPGCSNWLVPTGTTL